MSRLPPCCASCPELEARVCKLLADGGRASRLRLYTMPCDAKRLLRQRFRGYADDVARVAQERWESESVSAEEVRAALPGGPLDARVWLGTFAFDALACAPLEASHNHSDTSAPISGGVLPPPEGPFYRALAALARIEPADVAMITDGVRGAFDAGTWRAGLGASAASLADRLALGLYRALTLRFEVISGLAHVAERESLIARRFAPGDTGEISALAILRAALGDPTITVVSLRAWYKDAAEDSLRALQASPESGAVLSPTAIVAFRRALRLDPERGLRDDGEDDYAEPLFLLLSRDVSTHPPRGADAHPRARDLVRFALGLATDPTEASRLVEHLVACRDGRCNEIVRAEVSGVEATKCILAGPMSEPPPGNGVAFAGGPMLGPTSPHMIRCRDVLWETFSSMAQDEGKSVDTLVEDAMDRYRLLRTHVSEELGRRPNPSSPPEAKSAGLRFGAHASSPTVAVVRSTAPPPVPPPPESDEPTLRRGAELHEPDEAEPITPRT